VEKVAMYKEYIYKQAALNSDIKLYPHQQRFVDKPGSGVIAAHTVGGGKTLAAIARFEKLKDEGKANKALVVVPSSLRENFGKDGVGKFTDSKYNVIGNKQEIKSKLYNDVDPNADYNIISYDIFKKDPERYLKESGADTVISDESHRSKNEDTAVRMALKETRDLYKNFIGLTGSVVSNTVADVHPLVDIASGGKHTLGESKKDFLRQFAKRNNSSAFSHLPEEKRPIAGFRHKRQLRNELNKYIDYVDYDDIKHLANMPEKDIKVNKVPITKQQAKIYKQILNDDKDIKRMILNKKMAQGLTEEEARKAFNKLVASRRLMNSIGAIDPSISLTESAKITPKTKRLLDDLENHIKTTPDAQALLFSHLIDGGVDVLEAGLKDRNIEYGKFIGKGNKGVTEKTRQKDVDEYNKALKRVMLISGAGGEGLSLNNTTWEGVLDPHFNPEKMKQMEARGVRSGGLSHRKPEDRRVEINRYLATMPKTFGIFPSRYQTPDEFIYDLAMRKDKQNQLLFDLLKK